MQNKLSIINVEALLQKQVSEASMQAAQLIGAACRDTGFFYICSHGVDGTLQRQLEKLSHDFFKQDEEVKMKIPMMKGGKAWRGYFPVGGEFTSGKPDLKEGLYFGKELDENDSRVKAELPLHGRNLFPDYPPGLKETVLKYIEALTLLGHALMKGIALSLDLKPDYFYERYTKEPLLLFRIFHYPAQQNLEQHWGVGEHTDYGLLTILKQDDAGGLQVKSKGEWMDALPLPGTFICNIGDMLDRMTGGLYRSTPHCVLNVSGKSRFSFPFFFDPDFEAKVYRIENISKAGDDRVTRWDKASVHDFEGTYGDYLLRKIGKVFPELQKKVL